MFKVFLAIIILGWITPASASDRECNGLGLKQAFGFINIQKVTACFLYTETGAGREGQLSRDPDGVSVYSISESEKSALVYEFPYAGTKGKINDAFILSADDAHDEMLFVIHSIETPSSWDTTSDVYDVSVMKVKSGILVRDQVISRFFDFGGDLTDGYGIPYYVYPYKDRASVEKAIRSPVFKAVNSSDSITGTIKEKTFLYDGDTEPTLQAPSKMYLVKGDQITVKDSMAGWCKVSYAGKEKLIAMWVQCKSIAFPKN
jgi:hypothetical protein